MASHRCLCGREVRTGGPMASHRRACKVWQARQEQIRAESAAILARVIDATACPKCAAAPGTPCTDPGTRRPLSTVLPWTTAHHERHVAERVARLGY